MTSYEFYVCKYGGKAIQPASAPLDAAPTSHDPFPGE